jgi:hypothetical protein
MALCASTDKCGFFKKYESGKALACKGFASLYCRGPKMSECKRKEFREKNGVPPPDDMMPNGSTMAD